MVLSSRVLVAGGRRQVAGGMPRRLCMRQRSASANSQQQSDGAYLRPKRGCRRMLLLRTQTGIFLTEYNRALQAYSASPFTYQPEAGLYYHRVAPGVLVGTQPRSPADVSRLATEAGVTCVMNTQQDSDMAHWGVDLAAIQRRCTELGVVFVRYPFPDFSADGLRAGLPAAAAALDGLLEAGHVVYLHWCGTCLFPATALQTHHTVPPGWAALLVLLSHIRTGLVTQAWKRRTR